MARGIAGAAPVGHRCRRCDADRHTELRRPEGAGTGCSIYHARPRVCRDYQCGWLLSVLDDNWHPINCHMVVTLPYESHPACMVAVDPDHPNIWEQDPYLGDLKKLAAQYGFVQMVLAAAEGNMIGLVTPFRVIKLPLEGFFDGASL
jgi:hypothetical protein